MTNEQLIIWGLVIFVAILIIYWLRYIILAALGAILAFVIAVLALDKLKGGTGIDQIINRITNWLRARTGV